MSFFSRKKSGVPTKSTFYNAPVPFNGDQYTNLPDPGPGLVGDYHPNPSRTHAPYPLFKTSIDHLDEGSGDPMRREPDTASTQFYKETKEIPRDPVLVPANGVFVPGAYPRGYGWKQGFVPEAGRRAAMAVGAPPPMLDRPIVEVTVDKGYSKRTPQRLKAPKPYRRYD